MYILWETGVLTKVNYKRNECKFVRRGQKNNILIHSLTSIKIHLCNTGRMPGNRIQVSENYGFRMEFIIRGSAIVLFRLMFLISLSQWWEIVWTCSNSLDRTEVQTSLSQKMKEVCLWRGVIIHGVIVLKWMDDNKVHFVEFEKTVLNVWLQNACRSLNIRLSIRFVSKSMCVG
jgi:hypothetical protein